MDPLSMLFIFFWLDMASLTLSPMQLPLYNFLDQALERSMNT